MNGRARAALEAGQGHFFAEPPRYSQAAEAFREAARLAPRWPEPLGWLAGALRNLDEVPEAVRLLRRALKLDPTDPRYWIALGELLTKRHHWKDAVRALEKGLSLRPAYAEADARLFLAEAYLGTGRERDAEEQWRVIASMGPCYPSGDRPMQEALARLKGRPTRSCS